MRFEFATAGRIIFGAAALREVGLLAAAMVGSAEKARALVVTGRAPEATEPLLDLLAACAVDCVTFPIDREPTTDTVRAGTRYARDEHCNLVVGFGGGSALDAGKAAAALLTNRGDLLDYLEVIGGARPLTRPSAPCIAIPTTAGTGAEVTRNAVLASPEHRVKVSLRSPSLLPRLALVDPELTYDLPPAVTASTGLDALTQLIEPYVSVRANPLTDALCRQGMTRVARSLRQAYHGGDCPGAREDMAVASLFGGLALANAGLGAVHGFAGPLGGMFPAPHGAVCAALLPYVMAVNVGALKERDPENEALRRYDEIARILTGNRGATADDGVTWARQTGRELRIPPLASYGVTLEDADILVEKASVASSMRGNPITLTPDEMREILTRAHGDGESGE